MHHNTTNETGGRLRALNIKADSQEDLILRCFKKYARPFTPWQIHYIFEKSSHVSTLEITSVRRALTNLTNAGALLKMNKKRKGPKGGNEYYWKLK